MWQFDTRKKRMGGEGATSTTKKGGVRSIKSQACSEQKRRGMDTVAKGSRDKFEKRTEMEKREPRLFNKEMRKGN